MSAHSQPSTNVSPQNCAATSLKAGQVASPTTSTIKIVRTTQQTAEKLAANTLKFNQDLQRALNLSGIEGASVGVFITNPHDAGEQSAQINVSVQYPTHPDPAMEAFNCGVIHGQMNTTMYAHGYGENLGIEGTSPKGWTTHTQQHANSCAERSR